MAGKGLGIPIVDGIIKFGKRVLAVIAYVAAVLALTTALILAINTLSSGLMVSLPANTISFAKQFLPTNLSSTISVVISARLLRWFYDWHLDFVSKLTVGA